jgi:Flp pilus assembly protein TadG
MGNEGQTLVEMALLLPLLMLLVTGILSVGFAYSNQQALTQATGIAAQYLASARSSSTDPCAEVRSEIHDAAPQLDLTQLNVTLTMNGTSVSTNTCSGSATDLTFTGSYGSVTVYATYPCNIGVVGVNFSSSCTLQAQVKELEY